MYMQISRFQKKRWTENGGERLQLHLSCNSGGWGPRMMERGLVMKS
jgi:hypothetical protein